LELLSQRPVLQFSTLLPTLLRSPEKRIRESALQAFEAWPNNDIVGLQDILTEQLTSDNFNTRVIATKRVAMLGDLERKKLASEMINDVHPAVRHNAALALFPDTAQLNDLASWLNTNNGSPRSQEAVLNVILDRNPPRAMMESIALQLALDAKKLIQIRSSLATLHKHINDPRDHGQLLDIVLAERCLQILDLSLLAASLYENASTIGVLRAGINSQDKRHWASTCEAIRYIGDKNLAQQLVIILERLNGETTQNENATPEFTDVKSILAWAATRGDQWLLECATHCLRDKSNQKIPASN